MSYSKLIKESGEENFSSKSGKAKDDANPKPPVKLSPHMLEEVEFEITGTMTPEEIQKVVDEWNSLPKTKIELL